MSTYLLTAFALSMDAFSVSVSSGICVAELRFRHALRAALFFGFFQFLMPVIGYFLGTGFSAAIKSFDHFVAFALLAFVGGKMLRESFGVKDEASCSEAEISKKNILDLRTLFALSIATSIDALAVGISYSVLGAAIWTASGVIGVVTFAVCLMGCEGGRRLGSRIGARFERGAEILGGTILVAIGTRILVEHLARSI